MRLKIFSCHHLQPEFTCNTEIFQTLVSNVPAPEDGSFISDLDGINIAGDNLYSELRHQYYVWKNLLDSLDYVGFEHYRRPFFIDTLPAQQLAPGFPNVWHARQYFAAFNKIGLSKPPEFYQEYLAMRRALDTPAIEHLKHWIGSFDIAVPRPNIQNIEAQWKSCFDDDIYWHTMVEGMNRTGRLFQTYPDCLLFQMEVCYFGNMYIMRRELLNEYLTFCFDVLAFCRSRLPLRGRALGYFSERLFSFWICQKKLEQPSLRVLHLPLLILNRPNELGKPGLAARPEI